MKAEVVLALGSYGADPSSQPELMASPSARLGRASGGRGGTRPPVRSCCSQSKILPGDLGGLLTTSACNPTFSRPVETVSPPSSILMLKVHPDADCDDRTTLAFEEVDRKSYLGGGDPQTGSWGIRRSGRRA